MHRAGACAFPKPMEGLDHSDCGHMGWVCCDVLLCHDGNSIAFEGSEALAFSQNWQTLDSFLLVHWVQSSFVWFTVAQRGKGKNSFFQSGGMQRNKRHLHFLQFLAHIDDACADQTQVAGTMPE